MAQIRKDKDRETPALATSSLPDIIFMFLFFFMVITKIRQGELFVRISAPPATEVQKLERKNLVSYIYIGVPIKSNLYGVEPRIQLNDQFATSQDIAEFIANERAARDEADRQFLTTSMKVDKKVKMGVVTDVKQELRKVGAFKINYSTKKGKVTD